MSPVTSYPVMSPAALVYLYHHVFLPPKLPQEDDYDPDLDQALLDMVIHALHGFATHLTGFEYEVIKRVTAMITRLKEVHGLQGDVDEVKLKMTLEALEKEGDILPIHVRCQNAAVLITTTENAFHFETFELSPRNKAVNSIKGRLKRQFPGPTFAVDSKVFKDASLRGTIAKTLAKMSHQYVAGTKPMVKKAQQEHEEDRDTTDPKLVTEFFTAFLRPSATAVDSLQVHKNTREEVLWNSTRLPWRRSPLWLLIRVALQLSIRRLGESKGIDKDLYKHFMLYCMSFALEHRSNSMSDEICYIMIAKTAGRLHKLGLSHRPAWFQYVEDAIQAASSSLSENWRQIVARDGSKSSRLDKQGLSILDFEQDTFCSIPTLDNWRVNIASRTSSSSAVTFQPEGHLDTQHGSELPWLSSSSDPDYKIFNLAAFEKWVKLELDNWLEQHIDEETTCQNLGDSISRYHDFASGQYSKNPEATSLMHLTILELWIACDKSAVRRYPDLANYGTCIPTGVFESLVLPMKSQLERLGRAELYLTNRQRRVLYPQSCIFLDFGTPSCFAVKYFDQSHEHQELLTRIEDRARQEKEAKQAELRQKRQKYDDLMAIVNSTECTYEEHLVDRRLNLTKMRHNPSCKRCARKSAANSITICIHEWPLPANTAEAKSTVFELDPPRDFSAWRDVTIHFLLNILCLQYHDSQHPRAMFEPQTHSGLRKFGTSVSSHQRIYLLSENKPHEVTHRKARKILGLTENHVCLRNGMSCQYFDSRTNCFVATFWTTDKTAVSCTYQLPRPSSSLQQFLYRPSTARNGPAPNAVIASQDSCPQDMSLEEYKALCSMPLGVEVQWKNILRQLAMPSVVLKKTETCIFILQMICQAGPPSSQSRLRAGHVILNNDSFAKALLAEVGRASGRIKENWESAQELSALVFLTLRLHSLTSSPEVQEICLSQLLALRVICFNWVIIIRGMSGDSDSDERRNNLIASATHMALICASTYDCEGCALEQILADEVNASMWIQCSMMVHDRYGLLDMTSGSLVAILYYRWKIMAYRLYPVLIRNIVGQKQASMDLAVREAWPAYSEGSAWSAVSEECHSWIESRNGNVSVHFEALTGKLLVDGRPLARLPPEYEKHNTYTTLFGQSPVEVMPSGLPGMQFSGQKKHMGHTIHLGRVASSESGNPELCVRAIDGKDQAWEFVPPALLKGSFPDAFVDDCAHWYNLEGHFVEFRPLKEPWKSSTDCWRLQLKYPDGRWQLSLGDMSLVCMLSRTAGALSNILQPIERAPKVHCKLHRLSSRLEIDLPRLRLNFTLKSGQSAILSRQYRDMLVDPDQSLGTLTGLANKLILRSVHPNFNERKVLIPEGQVFWTKGELHVAVTIRWQTISRAHVYSVDHQLCRLADNGSIQSKLFLAYLHAVTSHCLPDPLTKRTGTEQSLHILRSASLRSFDQLQHENAVILGCIARLTPERSYYPQGRREMQNIKWQASLGVLAQRDEFRIQVDQILDQQRRISIFYPDAPGVQATLPTVNQELLERAKIRSSSFYTSEFGAEDHDTQFDCRYSELGRDHESNGCFRVFKLCKMISKRRSTVTEAISSDNLRSQLWGFLSRSTEVNGYGRSIEASKIQYDATWLLDPVKYVSSNWCSIHRLLCAGGARPNAQQAMIWISALTFFDKIPFPVLQALAAFYVMPSMSTISPPPRVIFYIHRGYEVNENDLRSSVHSHRLAQTPESSLLPLDNENYDAYQHRIDSLRQSRRNQVLQEFVGALRAQWPIEIPTVPSTQGSIRFQDYYNTQSAMSCIRTHFVVWFHNKELRDYLTQVATAIASQSTAPIHMAPCPQRLPAQVQNHQPGFVTVDDLLHRSLGPPPTLDSEISSLGHLLRAGDQFVEPASCLSALMNAVDSQTRSNYERDYVLQLKNSAKSLQDRQGSDQLSLDSVALVKALADHQRRCETVCSDFYNAILSRLTLSTAQSGPADTATTVYSGILNVLAGANIGPRLSPEIVLLQLTRERWQRLSQEWKVCLVAYGRSITAFQQAKRLPGLIEHPEDLIRELQNPGHTNWDPYDFPESLLLEVENGLLIRDVQEGIAKTMRDQTRNAVMQLNMGEGKSSVIVPIVAAALADGSSLVRVLVAKPQSRQMFHMLVSKLGGLLGRRVYHLPVSRSLKIDESAAMAIERMCLECMADGGVLLVQPEHILSLKLMCLECFISKRTSVGQRLLKILELFQSSSRDVVDESDENFSAKFELIYTMGSQRALELSPQRWNLIQELLDIVRRYVLTVKELYPQGIEVDEQSPGSFHRTRLLHEDATKELFEKIADHICSNGIDALPISRQPEAMRAAIRSYILDLEVSPSTVAMVEGEDDSGFWTASTRDPLLLLRGLLAGVVLASCLSQKRWRVNYGPHESRTPPTKLSVPYRAKDNPALRSEFSHPDVVVVLTCLSYYYGGLNDDELFAAFHHLLKSDQKDIEYQRWVDDSPDLPRVCRQLGGINLRDRHHCLQRVFPYLRFSKTTIDYFLAHLVFPKDMKEFPSKLSASGWDIGEVKSHPTVGFSGTNDSRITLPVSVKQLDLPEQNHTNALVLEYILRHENSIVLTPERDASQAISDTQALLNMVVGLDPPAQVILDVGAQILELTNLEVARTWLGMLPEQGPVQAVVFVNDSDEICVIDRTGLVEPLQISPFGKQLEACFVFLDEAHTRGIDLKLPKHYRAAVTLGAGITKDKLVQACMRMRKLGKGQSVVFCIPTEIKNKILSIVGKSDARDIKVLDVLRWAVSETWIEMQRSIPLWAVQGQRFERQRALWDKARSDGKIQLSTSQAEGFLEPESQTLEQRYRPRSNSSVPPIIATESDRGNATIRQILQRCSAFENINFHSTQLQEEQERQLAPEIEQERQVQRPPSVTPEKHSLHPDIRRFVFTGTLQVQSTAFIPAFQSLGKTSATKFLNPSEFPSSLLVTADYARTVKPPQGPSSVLDDYQRSVQWILTSPDEDRKSVKHMVIISPYEANELHSEILKSKYVSMHIYAPCQNRSYSPLDKLRLFTVPSPPANPPRIPASLSIQLNLFAGQLYISSLEEYHAICEFLRLASTATPEGMKVSADGFIISAPDGKPLLSTFKNSPLKFLKVLMSQIRKDGQEIDKTHIGRILDGKLLTEEDFCEDE
ncbi:uncharacterized protein BDV14DRAFT_201959 [Aspergillus stella-maris]|uniref:uncharacterized protein n=1 Tax=Aspergillus stella-maris TaxID=1810926 RepID=UPI003CCD41F4